MARIELRDSTIRLKDGLSGSAAINEMTPGVGVTTYIIDTVALNTTITDLVPIGARFTIAGESGGATHVVTGRTPATTSPTTVLVFTVVSGSGVLDSAVITFLPQQLDIKIGDGNVTWTVNKEYEYLLDRGNLDTVREADQQPLDISIDSVYEHITTGTSETISVYDALNGIGGAAEWVSASPDLCEPYAVDVEIFHEVPCATNQDETTLFPDYRYDSLEVDIDAATITTSGRCNATLPTVTRT